MGVAQSVTCADGACAKSIMASWRLAIVLLYQVTLGVNVLVLFSLEVKGKCEGWAYA